MVTIPVIERQSGTRALPVGNIAPQLRPPQLRLDTRGPQGQDAVTRAQLNLAGAVGDVGSALVDATRRVRERGNQMRLIEAQQQLHQYQTDDLYHPDTGALNVKGKDAFTLHEERMGRFNQFANELRAGLGNDEQRMALDKMVLSQRTTYERTLLRHQNQQMEAYAKTQVDGAVDAASTRSVLYHNQPEVVNSSIKAATDVLEVYGEMNGLPRSALDTQKQKVESNIRLNVLARQVDENPRAAIGFYEAHIDRFTGEDLLRAQRLIAPAQRRVEAIDVSEAVLGEMQPKVSSDGMIEFVMQDLEGGDQIVPDGKGVAKFGINSWAQRRYFAPDAATDAEAEAIARERISAMTAEEAMAFYKKEFWDKIGADKMPADLRMVAFDAAVNHGVSKAKSMLEEAGGDARKLLELRAKEYDRLAKADPDQYAENLPGWQNRLATLTAQLDIVRGARPSELDMLARIDEMTDDPDVAADAKKILRERNAAIEAEVKRAQEDAEDEAWQYRLAGKDVPLSVEARMNPETAFKMRKEEPPDLALYADLRRQILDGEDVDLKQHRWDIGDSNFKELVKLQQEPKERATGRKVEDVIKSAQGILLGRSTPEAGKRGQFEQVEAFRRVLYDEIEAHEKMTGKDATAEDVQRISDRMLLNVEATDRGLFGQDVRAFELEPGEAFEVPGIPDKELHFINGQQVDYQTLVTELQGYLENRGRPVNRDTMQAVYEALREQGTIVMQRGM